LIPYNPIDFVNLKTTYTTPKNIIWLKKFQDNIFFNIKITICWMDLGQLRLTCQICDLGYATIIISKKTNPNKLWNIILNQPHIEMMKLKKKKYLKKNLKKWHELTFQNRDPSHKTKITIRKANQNKLWITIPNQPNI